MNVSLTALLLAIFCALMLVVIVYVLHQQRKNRAHNQHNIDGLLMMLDKQNTHRVESVAVIARAMQAKQCELSEGCIRLTMLIEQLDPQLLSQAPYCVFKEVYNQTDHMPIKDAWEKLDRSVKAKLNAERRTIEDAHRERIAQAVDALLQHRF